MFIEDTAIDLIALDPDIPYTDLEFTCQQKVWYVEEVRDKLKHLLRTDLPLIRVDQTEYEPVPLNRPYEAAHYIWEVTSLKYPSTHVSFSYDEKWPFEFYVRPNHGPILKSNAQQGQELLSFLCIHLWHFTYDARFPVLVTITDEPGKKYDGFTFNFGFEAGISRNRPDKTNFGITTFDFEQPSSDDERFCKESQKNILTVHTFENVSTDDYGDLTEEIDKVDITYTCLRLKCPIGQTEWSFGGAVSILSKEFPYCVNGILKGTKEDYKDSQIFVTTNEEKTVDLYLTPIINKNFTVVKHYQYSNLLEEELDKDETAIITLKRKNTSFTSAIYPTIEENAGLELLAKWDYTYDLEIYLADDAGIIGGYKAEWTPSWDMMKNTNEIKFHVIEWPYTEDQAEQYQFLAQLETQSQSVPKPELR